MSENDKTRKELISELDILRRRIAELEKSEAKYKEAEETLRPTEERYRAFIANSTEGIWCIELEKPCPVHLPTDEKIRHYRQYSIIAECNDALARMYGFGKAEELIGKHISEFVPKTRRKDLLKKVARANFSLTNNITEEKDRSGNKKYFLNNSIGIIENGLLYRIWGTQQDITEQKLTGEALKESEAKFRCLAEESPNMIFIYCRGKILYANRGCEEIMGYSRDEFYSPEFSFLKLIAPESVAIVKSNLALHLANREVEPYEYTLLTRNNRRLHAIINTKLIQYAGATAILGIVTDVTDRKSAEEALKESDAFNRAVIEHSPVGISIRSAKGKLLSVNNAWKQIYALSDMQVKEYMKEDPPTLIFKDGQKRLGKWLPAVEKVYKEGGHLYIPELYIAGDQSARSRWVSLTYYAIMDGNDKVNRVVILTNDITDRRQIESALKESKERYKELADSLPEIVFEADNDGSLKYVNRNAHDKLGYSRQEFEGGLNAFNMFIPEDRERARRNFQGILNGDIHIGNEYTALRKDGTTFPILVHSQPIIQDGKPTGLRGIIIDITEQKNSEEILRKSRHELDIWNRISKSFLTQDDTIVYNDVLDIILEILKSVHGIFGYIDEDDTLVCPTMTKGVWDRCLIPDKDFRFPKNTRGNGIWGRVIREQKTLYFNGNLDVPVGHITMSRVICTPIIFKGRTIGVITIANKKTNYDDDDKKLLESIADHIAPILHARLDRDKKRAQRDLAQSALSASEEKYRKLIATTIDAVMVFDAVTKKFIDVNAACEKLYGYTKEEFLNLKIFDISAEPIRTVESIDQILGSDLDFIPTFYHRKKDGTIFPIEMSTGNFTQNGQTVIFGFIRDITKRKKAEKTIRESELKYRTTIDSLSDNVYVIDRNFNILLVNSPLKKWCVQLNINNDFTGKTIFQAFTFLNESVRDDYIRVMHTGMTLITEETYHIEGRDIITETRKIPVFEGMEVIRIITVIRDITETRRLQKLEARAQRLETAGRVAGQVAHDFNNLLAPLVAYPEFIKEELPENHRVLKYIDDMEHSANQIAEINQQLLTLSRRGHYNQNITNINDIIQRALREMGTLPHTLLIDTDLDTELMNIIGGAAQIHRVITNLINNARDAMQDIGKISIKTENYYADNPTAGRGPIPRGEYVKLTITDNGCGIPENIRPSIFDPFFTTKTSDKKRGSGLGLSVVDAVIKDHDGYIDLKSTVGEGTSFFLYFPITRDKIDQIPSDNIIGGAEKILVVDDDKGQCEVALKLLEKLGYEASVAYSGEEAIKLLADKPHDLLILDMIIPGGMDGTETYRHALAINPEQKAIIVSGFAETERVNEAIRLGAGTYTRKPLTLRTIAPAIRTVLDAEKATVL